ncbi:MAG: hypothetical protein GEV28_23125 [Actinophytocola sp.]|uniref:hypothetical protein n=1 Tax=Actinophytocola sp. TaxID=1872138 RepID=UPI00132C10ED|nr:hypothetical protein [Actinophytocola sp.]MPZ83126.1 hypothetical protein [Actinophytocola sp.]
MSVVRAALLAVLTAVVVAVVVVVAMGTPVSWAIVISLPAGAAVLLAGLFSGAFDADWTPEPDRPSSSVCLHATSLTERLSQAAADPYRFTSRVQPRLRRLAVTTLRRDPDTADIADLHDPRARARLGDDLHRLLTAHDASLPKPNEFAALVRRLEEL